MTSRPHTFNRPASAAAARGAFLLAVFAILAAALPSAAGAQANPPIPPFYQVHGGLYYPSMADFRENFGFSSDFAWGTGFGLPISPDFLYILIDISWFQGKGYRPEPVPGEHEMTVAFWHAGLLDKVFVTKTVALRFQGGLNLNQVKLKFTPQGEAGTERELKRKLGFYGGAGIENQMFGGKMGIFADFVYDYRRSTDPLIYGDFGGYRLVAGLEAFLF